MKCLKYLLLLILLIAGTDLFSAPELKISRKEVLTYKVRPEKGDVYTTRTVYKCEREKGSLLYSYTHYDKYDTFKVKTNANAVPEKIIRSNAESSASFTFDGTGSVKLLFKNNSDFIEKNGQYTPNVSVENALVARTLDLTSSEKYEFDLIQCDKLPELNAYRMYFQVKGKSSVTVNAGTFNCKKVLFSLTGWKGMFYKAYYYISDDEHRYIVKIENMPEGGSSELVKIETSDSKE